MRIGVCNFRDYVVLRLGNGNFDELVRIESRNIFFRIKRKLRTGVRDFHLLLRIERRINQFEGISQH